MKKNYRQNKIWLNKACWTKKKVSGKQAGNRKVI